MVSPEYDNPSVPRCGAPDVDVVRDLPEPGGPHGHLGAFTFLCMWPVDVGPHRARAAGGAPAWDGDEVPADHTGRMALFETVMAQDTPTWRRSRRRVVPRRPPVPARLARAPDPPPPAGGRPGHRPRPASAGHRRLRRPRRLRGACREARHRRRRRRGARPQGGRLPRQRAGPTPGRPRPTPPRAPAPPPRPRCPAPTWPGAGRTTTSSPTGTTPLEDDDRQLRLHRLRRRGRAAHRVEEFCSAEQVTDQAIQTSVSDAATQAIRPVSTPVEVTGEPGAWRSTRRPRPRPWASARGPGDRVAASDPTHRRGGGRRRRRHSGHHRRDPHPATRWRSWHIARREIFAYDLVQDGPDSMTGTVTDSSEQLVLGATDPDLRGLRRRVGAGARPLLQPDPAGAGRRDLGLCPPRRRAHDPFPPNPPIEW